MSNLEAPILDRLREAAALRLWEAGAVRLSLDEPFLLASGNRSPIYVNCRQVISDPAFMYLFSAAATALCRRRGIDPDAVAGGATAGIPYAAWLARDLGLPLLYVRKKAKGHGLAARVEGTPPAGGRVLLVEDLVTDGGSKVGFIEALREAGTVVQDALVLFDRQQGGTELLAGHGVRLHSVTDRSNTLALAEATGLIPAAARREVDAYFAAPGAWHQERGLPYTE